MARWISGIALAVLVVALLFYAPLNIVRMVIVLLGAICAWEFLKMHFSSEALSMQVISFLVVVLGILVIGFSAVMWHVYQFIFSVCFVGAMFQLTAQKSPQEKLNQMSLFVFGVFYICVPFGLMIGLSQRVDFLFWMFLVLGVTFAGDTGAYLAGKTWGKNLLCPDLSPKKTVEGVVGGLILGEVAALLIWYLWGAPIHWSHAVLLGPVLVILGVLGDLLESLLKRAAGVKDSGALIPGHGGLLDRVDGALFTTPFVYFVAKHLV